VSPQLSTGPIQTLVYPAIGHAEFGRLLQKYGYDAEAIKDKDRMGYRTLGAPRFTAWMQTPFHKRPGEFAAIFLWARLRLQAAIVGDVLQAVRWKTMYAHLNVDRDGALVAAHTLVVSGGITEYYLRDQLWHWARDLKKISNEARRQLGLAYGRTVH